MAKRGVLYMVWGDRMEPFLERSVRSLHEHHPDMPVHVARLGDAAGDASDLLQKARVLDVTPFEQTLFLDADTVVLGSLDFGFEQAGRFGAACAICENPWARRYGDARLDGDMVEYNTGVLFFTEKARPLFDAWLARVGAVDSSVRHVQDGKERVMAFNDQAGFALAVAETGLQPFVLPLNWNFRPQWHKAWFGPLKVWHDYDDVPEQLKEHNRRQAAEGETLGFSRIG